MNILVDATEISMERLYSSIPMYIMRILSQIALEERNNYTLLINKNCNSFFKNHYPGFKLITFDFKGWNKYWHSNLKYRYTIYKFNKLIKQLKIDVIFIPTDYPYYLQEKLNCKKVVVIHDLKGIKRNCNTLKEAYEAYSLNKMYERHLKSADKIIAISKYTKQDILSYYTQINETKIHVIYNSVDIATKTEKPNYSFDNPYILYVNTLHQYKNVSTLIKSFAKLSNNIVHNLIVVGKTTPYWDNEIKPLIKNLKIENRIIQLQGLSDEELRYMYENAALFVTPSLHEGFGLTPIEAAICKCPVICSIQEALPDSTRGLLNYYQPAMDDEELTKIMRNLLNTPPCESELNKISEYYRDIYSPIKQFESIKNLLIE